jgi:hypothetical protein
MKTNSNVGGTDEPAEEGTDDSVEKKPEMRIKVEQINGADPARHPYDPTAEIESTVPDAVVINVKGGAGDKKDTINVFKFTEEKRAGENAPSITDEEIHRRKISDLTGHKWETENVPEGEATEPEMTVEKEAPKIKIFSEADTSIPKKEEIVKKESVIERTVYEPDPIPEGLDNASSGRAANDTSEYNSFSMRDSFKDKFLDSIMAVRIRLFVAFILGAITVCFDIFEREICEYFNFGDSLSAPALIDGCLIISLFLIMLPECARGIKQLFSGIVTPELSYAIVGAALFAYTVSMISIAKERYPLFASVYAIMAINAVFATNCLHSANFFAFKTVSEKGTKHIIDKPLTRSLELENIALDGVVDEYRSKTARMFKTGFVSDFFENCGKGNENTKNNLIVLALSFGAALIGGGAIFFISGIQSALEVFALTISLSLPAFSVLSHKLPFKVLERRAEIEGSAVIGERALYDFSGVDVMVFEDTEVFGPDDVTLKSASDRRSDYIDSMRKMASLFEALGGPLCRVFERALNKKCPAAYNVVIEDDGAMGIVDGNNVMAGTAEYMRRHGVRIPSINDYKVGSTKIIYAASDGEFFATFTVNYSFSEEFALMLSAMREKGIVPLIYTRDFNINNSFMSFLTGGADVIRVMKKYSPVKEEVVYPKISSPMVTLGDKTSALDLLLVSKKYTGFESVVSILELVASSVGAAAAIAISVALSPSMFALPTAFLALWQIGWSAALGIMSFKTFTLNKKDRKNASK